MPLTTFLSTGGSVDSQFSVFTEFNEPGINSPIGLVTTPSALHFYSVNELITYRLNGPRLVRNLPNLGGNQLRSISAVGTRLLLCTDQEDFFNISIYVSDDDGANWNMVNVAMGNSNGTGCVGAASDGNTLMLSLAGFAGLESGSFLASFDNGDTFVPSNETAYGISTINLNERRNFIYDSNSNQFIWCNNASTIIFNNPLASGNVSRRVTVPTPAQSAEPTRFGSRLYVQSAAGELVSLNPVAADPSNGLINFSNDQWFANNGNAGITLGYIDDSDRIIGVNGDSGLFTFDGDNIDNAGKLPAEGLYKMTLFNGHLYAFNPNEQKLYRSS